MKDKILPVTINSIFQLMIKFDPVLEAFSKIYTEVPIVLSDPNSLIFREIPNLPHFERTRTAMTKAEEPGNPLWLQESHCHR